MPKLTDPSILEVTTLDDADLIHNVDVSDLTDPGGTSKKINFLNLKQALGASPERRLVYSLADFPTASGGEIALDPITYIIINFIDLGTDSLRPSPLGNTYILGNNLNAGLQYSGTGTMIVGNAGSLVIDKLIYLAPLGTYYDLDNSFELYGFDSIGLSSVGMGTVKCNVFSYDFLSFYDNGDGFIFDDRTDGGYRSQVILGKTGFLFNKNNTTTLFDFQGTDLESIYIEQSSAQIGSNETLFNFSDSLKINNTQIVVNVFTTLSEDGALFAPNSLDQRYIYSQFSSNIGSLEDSTSIVKLNFEGNSAQTVIAGVGTNTPIITNVPYAIDPLIERFLIQDECTFVNGTNTINTTFNHGKINGDRILFYTYTGTLPTGLDNLTEYYIINAGATSFQVSLTQGGAAVTFSDNGTGTNYLRSNTGNTILAEMVYNGISPVKLTSEGWAAIANIDASDNDFRTSIQKRDLAGNYSELQGGSLANADNTKPQSMVHPDVFKLVRGEAIVIYVRNDSIVENAIVEAILNTIKKG